MADDLKRTAFYEAQDGMGATWTDWEGWSWADHFGDPVAEHEATRTALNIWDEAPLRKWDVRGPDALALMDLAHTNDMAALVVGQVRYAAVCDENGKMIIDGTVFRMDEDHCMSITSYDSDLDWFKSVAEDRGLDAELRDITAETPHFQVQGPLSRDFLAPITEGADLTRLRYFRFIPEEVRVAGVPCMVSRTGYSGELGYELYPSVENAAELWHAVWEAGKPHGMSPLGLSALESVRIECGLLFPDVDYFPRQTDPFEVRMDPLVKLEAGDFVGKDALRRIAAEGTPRLLSILRLEGDELPEAGASVSADGREAGEVRSMAKSPTYDMQVLAAAAVDRELAQEGQELEVAVGDGTARATVASFPLYDPEKRRPRS